MTKWFRRLGRQFRPSVPPNVRVYAVGDIHGRLDLLDRLLAKIEDDNATRGSAEAGLIFLGDLVDRGPDSRGVVERLRSLNLQQPQARFVMGNHDAVFLQAAAGDPRAVRFLVRIGGRHTLTSYGISEAEYADMDYPELAARFARLVPQEHLSFLSSFEDCVAVGDYLFVHAGLRPGIPLEQQTPEDLRWIRHDFLDSRSDFGKMVVHGHTVTEDVEIKPNRIGIDTGAYASGRLTALGLEGDERWFLTS